MLSKMTEGIRTVFPDAVSCGRPQGSPLRLSRGCVPYSAGRETRPLRATFGLVVGAGFPRPRGCIPCWRAADCRPYNLSCWCRAYRAGRCGIRPYGILTVSAGGRHPPLPSPMGCGAFRQSLRLFARGKNSPHPARGRAPSPGAFFPLLN